MEVLFRDGGGESFDLEVVPIMVRLPIPNVYLENEELRGDLRLIVREVFYEPGGDNNSLVQRISFEEGEKSEFSQEGRVIYESGLGWGVKLENLILKRFR